MSESPFSLAGRTVLVTGATSGIGRGCAELAAQMGATVFATGRDAERLAATVEALERDGHGWLAVDLSTPEGRAALLDALPTVQGVIHVAGRFKALPVKFASDEHFAEQMRINFELPILLTRDLVKNRTIADGGSIAFVASAAPLRGPTGHAAYAASKGALLSAMRVFAREFALRKIRVNALCPGSIRFPAPDQPPEEVTVDPDGNFPLGFGLPGDIAAGAVYLLSDAGRWITGTSLVMDGGLTLR